MALWRERLTVFEQAVSERLGRVSRLPGRLQTFQRIHDLGAAADGLLAFLALFVDHFFRRVGDELLVAELGIDARNVGGATPLYIAAQSDRAAAVHLLLAKGANPNLAGHGGLTPLVAAAYNGNDAIVADLLAHRADPNLADKTEKTAILYAAAKGFAPVVRRLLEAGVDSKATYGNRLTALMWAAGYADDAGIDDAQNVARLLLDHSWNGQGHVAVLGPEDLSPNEMAQIMSEVLGRPIRYQQIPGEALKATMVEHGMSEAMAQAMLDMMTAKNEGIDKAEPRTPESTTPTSFRQWCEEVLKPAVLAEA